MACLVAIPPPIEGQGSSCDRAIQPFLRGKACLASVDGQSGEEKEGRGEGTA